MGPSEQAPPPLLARLIDIDKSVSLRFRSIVESYESIWTFYLLFALRLLEISNDGSLFFLLALSLRLSPLSTPAATPLFSSLLVGLVLNLLLVSLAKLLIRRKGEGDVGEWSFPSAHSSRACFVAAFLSLSSAAQLSLSRAAVVLVALGLGSWAAAASFSRVLFGRHFVSDVIAGALLSVLEALLVFQFIFMNYSFLESYASTNCAVSYNFFAIFGGCMAPFEITFGIPFVMILLLVLYWVDWKFKGMFK